MTMETKNEIFEEEKTAYFKAKAKKKGGRKEQAKILDRVCEVTKMHRKAAIRKFTSLQTKNPWREDRRGRRLYFTPDVTAALKDIWEASGEICGELLHPMIAEYLAIFQRDTAWKHSDEATGKLCAISEGTVKNRVGCFLKARSKGRGISSTSPSQIKHIIPIFHGNWKKKLSGTGQIDTVAHCGHTLVGNVIYTLNFIDIPTLWDILKAQWNKGQIATQESLAFIRTALPWDMIEVHPDTGSEFVNWHMKSWCDSVHIAMTRSRPNHKNDNMHVEERNGHIVRKWIGYQRFDCREAVDALNAVYAVLCPYLNHFIPSRRLIEKIEVNGKWQKRYEKVAKTPYQRVLENKHVTERAKEKLRQEHAFLNPAVMKKEIDRLRTVLYAVQRKHGTQQNSSKT